MITSVVDTQHRRDRAQNGEDSEVLLCVSSRCKAHVPAFHTTEDTAANLELTLRTEAKCYGGILIISLRPMLMRTTKFPEIANCSSWDDISKYVAQISRTVFGEYR